VIDQDRLGHLDQAVLATERPAIDVRIVHGFCLRINAHRGLDIGAYSLGLEPANCSVLGRAHDRAEGTLPFLEPGQERRTRMAVTAEEVA
jgi:hypothetical protein